MSETVVNLGRDQAGYAARLIVHPGNATWPIEIEDLDVDGESVLLDFKQADRLRRALNLLIPDSFKSE